MHKIGSLRAKLLAALVMVALLGVGTVALVINRVTTYEFETYVRRGGMMHAQELAVLAADYYARNNSWQGIEDTLEASNAAYSPGMGHGQGMHRMATMGQSRILIVGPDKQVVVDTEGKLVGQSIKGDVASGAPILANGQTVGTLLITTSDLSGRSDLEKQFLSAVNRAVLWAVGAVAVAALVAAAILSRQLVGPLRQLTAASRAMAGGDLAQRVHVQTRDEIGELGQTFNQMAGDLQAAEAQRRQMTADIAHELRNPLSVIRGNLEALLDGIYPADAGHLGPIYEETILLQRLVEDLRLLSLAEAGQLHLVYSDVDAGALLAATADSARAIADDRSITMRVEAPAEPVMLTADADRLRQVVGNLVSNALRYTPTGGTVTLQAARDGDRVRISVSDTGPGIAPADLPHVFDRFYRGDADGSHPADAQHPTARDRASGGSGLGLAIARALAQAHGGDIDIKSSSGQGTTFIVSFSET